MTEFFRSLRRVVIRWQLRSLEEQADNIMVARQQALVRLVEIERERCRMKAALWDHRVPQLRPVQ